MLKKLRDFINKHKVKLTAGLLAAALGILVYKYHSSPYN